MAVMKAKQFVDTCIAIANSPTVYYSVSGGAWCKWNGSKWNMDCVCMIKGILWGFNFNKNAAHGGAIYGSNGVYDDNADQIMKRCTKISTDFKNIKIGEILHMGGHVGVYIGNRQVVETTAAWDYCTQISTVDENGARHKGNNYCGYWQNHGELSYIDYSSTPEPNLVNVYYRVKTKENGWLDEVKNLEDYAGLGKNSIIAFMVRVDKGSVWYQAHVKNVGWLPRVTGYDINNFENGYAGDDRVIDCVRIYYNTPEDIIKKYGYKQAKYRINNLPWQIDDETSKGQDGYAGNMGESAYKLEIIIK